MAAPSPHHLSHLFLSFRPILIDRLIDCPSTSCCIFEASSSPKLLKIAVLSSSSGLVLSCLVSFDHFPSLEHSTSRTFLPFFANPSTITLVQTIINRDTVTRQEQLCINFILSSHSHSKITRLSLSAYVLCFLVRSAKSLTTLSRAASTPRALPQPQPSSSDSRLFNALNSLCASSVAVVPGSSVYQNSGLKASPQ